MDKCNILVLNLLMRTNCMDNVQYWKQCKAILQWSNKHCHRCSLHLCIPQWSWHSFTELMTTWLITSRISYSTDTNCLLHNSYKKSNKMQQCIKIYFIFIRSSTCFGRHTAHHQEPKTALAASGFACVEGCWTCSCWTLSGRVWEDAVAWLHILILYRTASSNYTSNNLPRN